jgi:hypothetical protein
MMNRLLWSYGLVWFGWLVMASEDVYFIINNNVSTHTYVYISIQYIMNTYREAPVTIATLPFNVGIGRGGNTATFGRAITVPFAAAAAPVVEPAVLVVVVVFNDVFDVDIVVNVLTFC